MLSLRRLLAGACLWLAAFAPVHAQIDPTDPGSTNALQFEYSVQPTNDAILITLTTNVISITVSNAAAFTNVVITGTFGTNVVEFLDDGTPPDDAPGDGVFRGNLVAPFVEERQPLLVSLLLIGADIASVTNEPPADPPVMVTNRGSVSYIIVPRPRNDNFTNAFKLLSAGGVALGTNEYASLEPREPVHGQVAGNNQSVWWTWGAPADGPVLVDLAGTAFPAVLAVYEGPQLTNLVPVAASTNDPALNIPPHATFNARRGTTYRIAVSGIDTNSFGSIRLRVAPGATPDTRPPVVSITTPAQDSLVSQEFITITGSAREAFPLDSGVSNVVIQINDGPRTNAIGAESWAASVQLPPGTNVIRAYAIDYAGNTSPPDSVVVRYLNPTNDYFALSAQLEPTGGFVTANNRQATREAGEPLHAGNDGGRSVWYWWRAPADGQLALTTAGSQIDTLLAVYTGDRLADLVEVVSNDDGPSGNGWSDLDLFVSSNEVYRIVVDAYGADEGSFSLQYVFTPVVSGTFFNIQIAQANGGAVSPPGGAFRSGARVTFTAVPQEDFAFAGWQGDIVSNENPLTITVSRSLRLTPRFRTVRFTDDFETGDLTRIPWQAGAPAWIVQTNTVGAGSYAARSAPIGPRETSSLVLSTNTGAGTASFDLRVSSEPSWDFLEFLIDGTVVRRWSGEVPWQTFTFNLSAGAHTLTWRYTKDPNFESGLDAAFIDNLYVPPPRETGSGSEQPTLSVSLFAEGAQITLEGEPGVTYRVQAASNIEGPWTTIATQSSASGIINVLDLQSSGAAVRFYRALGP